MTDPVFFADVVSALRSALLDDLPDNGYSSVPVVSRVPATRPTTFVRLFRTGGPRMNLVADDAQVTVECWSDTDTDAHDLAQVVRALIYSYRGSIIGGVTVYRVRELAGPGWLPDPLSDQPRWTQTFTVATRGVASL